MQHKFRKAGKNVRNDGSSKGKIRTHYATGVASLTLSRAFALWEGFRETRTTQAANVIVKLRER